MSLQVVGLEPINLLALEGNGQQIIASLESQSSFLITNLSLSYPGLSIVLQRNTDPNRLPYYDDFRVDQQQNQPGLPQSQRLDIDRASWVVETAWRRDQQAEIPAPLLEGITRSLFSDRNDAAQAHSAPDDLASALVGNASQLKLKMGGNELNFDRKGIAGLGKTEA
jgi:hypothetical protein